MPTARRSCLLNLTILFFLLASFAVSVILADAQEAIGITPFMWIEKKYCVWDYDFCRYYVYGWWTGTEACTEDGRKTALGEDGERT